MIFPPKKLLQIVVLVAFCVWLAILWLARHQPYLGLAFKSGGVNQLEVVHSQLPNFKPGDRLVGLVKKQGQLLTFNQFSNLVDPDTLPSYQDYNRFFNYQRQLYQSYLEGPLIFKLDKGTTRQVTPKLIKPVSALPWRFWVLNLIGTLALLIGAWLWSYRPAHSGTGFFFLSGIGFYLNTASSSVYAYRELLIEPNTFWVLSGLNQFSYLSFGYFMVAVFMVYPVRLVKSGTLYLLLAWYLLLWINQVMQWIQWPLHTYSIHLIIPMLLGIVMAYRQCFCTKL